MGCEVSKKIVEKKEKEKEIKDFHWITINPSFEDLDSYPEEISILSLLDQDRFMNQTSNFAILYSDNTIKVKHQNNLHNYIPKEGSYNTWIYNSTQKNED